MASDKCLPNASSIAKLLLVIALLLIPAFSLLIYVLVTTKLEDATCRIMQVLSDGIRVRVHPHNSQAPFSAFVSSDANDAGRELAQGQRLACFFEPKDDQTTVKFSSNGRTKRTIGIVLISVWLGMTVAAYLYYFSREGCGFSVTKFGSSSRLESRDTPTSDPV